ncbi:MAG: FxsA family protein [Thiotrichales bacterium]|jgi:UPF0716 protein FxsA|nr:FxsA family protein [Thiotrichales bacterium]MBT3613366.1 FxsA family protein [Thiotrichales bacterium]MBT3751850.1 FxsA family protein [Thiotrichales bacterium]MBT3837611.1 FxsA family protein [Thiotrichales bacterium]MBT4152333.1 FxsA family protein [Thiotrichales bacterium]
MKTSKVALLFFILIPIVEIYLLMEVGSIIGVLPTILLVVLTAVVGVTLLKAQGLSTLMNAQSALARGEVPALQLLEGAALLVSGALLLTPGFVTDFIGFLGLIPTTRRAILAPFLKSASSRVHSSVRSSTTNEDIIEGEFYEKDDPRIGK